MSGKAVRVLVIDDHALVREGIRRVLHVPGELEVVGEAGSGSEVESLVEELHPDVVVMDVTMPNRSGLEVTRDLSEHHPDVRVLILTMHHKQEYVLDAVRAGAHGYVLKDGDPEELRRAIEVIAAGESFYTPWATTQISAAMRGKAPAGEDTPLERLTPRERQILAEVARGRTSREIGEKFDISPRTVESHRLSVMDKLEIRTVAGLTRFAIQHGLVRAE